MGTRSRREREKRQRRRDILDAARSLFWQHGYSGTTMPCIAEAAELAPGTLYLYFPSKGSLYCELLVEGYDILEARLRGQVNAVVPLAQQAKGLIDTFVQFAREHPEYFDIIFFVVQREGRRGRDVLQPDQVERLAAKEAACKAIVADVLRRGNGSRPEAEFLASVEAIWSMLVGVIIFFRKDPPDVFDAVVREAKGLLLRALFGGR